MDGGAIAMLDGLPLGDWQFYTVTAIALIAGWFVARPYLRARKRRKQALLNGQDPAEIDYGCTMCSSGGAKRAGKTRPEGRSDHES